MNRMKISAFWIIIAAIVVAEIGLYFFVVKGSASANTERINAFGSQGSQLARLKPVNQAVLQATESKRQALDREYAMKVLFLIGKDDLIDRYHPGFGDRPRLISPQRHFNLSQGERISIGESIVVAVHRMTEQASALNLLPRDSRPWDIIELSGAPDIAILQYGHKQYWVQKELFDLLRKPIPGDEKQLPAIARINRIQFEPVRDTGVADPRFREIDFSIDVALSERNIGIVLERIARTQFPITIRSFSVVRGADTARRDATVRTTDARLVSLRIQCRLIDFAMGVDRVVFSTEHFENPEAVSAWLESQTDPAMLVLKAQLEKHDVRPTVSQEAITYIVYNLRDEKRQCEIADGVTLYYGTLPSVLPARR